MTKRNLLSSEEVANIITSVLLADKRSMTVGVSLAELDSEYRELNGTRVPFRALGYPSLLDFLESLQRKNEISLNKRDGMHVVYLRVNKKTAHVSALVSGQKDSNKRNSRGGRKRVMRSFSNEYYRPPRLDSKTLAAIVKLVKNSARGMPIHRIMEYLKDRFVRNVNEQHLIRQLQEINHEVFVKDDTVYPILRSQRTSQPISSEWSTNATNENSSSKKPEVNLQPAGCSDSENEDNFKYVSAAKKTECARQSTSINNNQTSRMNEESKAVESPAVENANACFREDENSCLADEKDIGMLVDKKTRFRLEKLIQKHSEGIWCAELPMFYRKEYEIPLCYEGLGFDGVSDFAAHLPEIFHCVRLQDNGDFKLFNAKAPKPEDKHSERPSHLSLAAIHNIYESLYDEEEACPVTLSSLTSEKLIPNGVMRVGETTGQLFVTELFRNTDDSIDVVVVDVITPTFFWIQLLKKTSRFKTFMTELHEFYTENASKYVVPIVLLERGLNCACIYDKIWHRGIIKSVKHDNTVTVMFYDYGTVMNYQSHQIHFLHRSFSSLPAQAIPCGLYNVKPKFTDKWPQIVCQEFVSKVLDVPLVAMLGSIDADNNSMLIALTNTEGNMDFHVNDWMVSSGYAVYGKMGETVDTNETYDDSLVVTNVNDGTMNQDVGHVSLISSLLTSELSMEEEPTITEKANIFLNHLIENIAQTSPQILNGLFQQIKTLAMSMLMKDAVANGFLPNVPTDVSTVDVNSLQSTLQQIPDQDAYLKEVVNLLENMKINEDTQQESVKLEPPTIPSEHTNSNEVRGSYGAEYKPENTCINGNDYVQDVNVGSNFKKHDVNMNFPKNSDNYSSYSWASTLVPQFFVPAHELPSINGNQLDSNNLKYSAAPTFASQCISTSARRKDSPLVNSQDSQLAVTKNTSTPCKIFGESLEQTAKSFFERLEAKSNSKIRETNPFKMDIENDKFHSKNWLPVTSPQLLKCSRTNPFVNEDETIEREKISTTRMIYEAKPVMYNSSMKDKAQSKKDIEAKSLRNEQEAFEASKQLNVSSWINQDCNSNEDYFSYPCNFAGRPSVPVNLRQFNVPPPLPPRPCARTSKLDIDSEVFKAPDTNVQNTANITKFTALEHAEKAIDFQIKGFPSRVAESCEERTRDDIAVGGPATKIERDDAEKREETVKRKDVVNREVEVKREADLLHTDKACDFKKIQLTKQIVYLIHLDNEGWLTVDEFLVAFTIYKVPDAIIKILEILNAKIPFRFIKRSDYPKLFDDLERTSIAVPRTHNNKIGDTLHLAPIKSLLKMLRKLKIVELKELEEAKRKIFPKRSTALFDAYTLITMYANL